MAANELESLLQQTLGRAPGLVGAVVTDGDGVPVAKVTTCPEGLTSTTFLVTATMAAEQASKLGFGASKCFVINYEKHQVLHFDAAPLFVHLIAGATANTGLLMDVGEELVAAVIPLQRAMSRRADGTD